MSTPSNAIPETSLPPRAVDDIPAIRQFDWSVRRELWESRSVYLAPAAVALLYLAAFLVTVFRLPAKIREAGGDMARLHGVIGEPFELVAFMIMAVSFLVALFYCLDALYGERRDRSILFWKSLPVSDTTAVLAKAAIPMFAIPVITIAVTVAVQVAMLLVASVVLAASGVGAGMLWSHLSLWHMWGVLLVHLIAGHGLWYAPFYGWLLLVSAWARRVPFLWAVLPVLAIAGVEKIAFNSAHFIEVLQYRVLGGPQHGGPHSGMGMEALTPYTFGQLLSSPGLWIGLAVTAAFLWGAIRLRRSCGPI